MFIFLVLAAQFESYFDPLVILVAVPLALMGGVSGAAADRAAAECLRPGGADYVDWPCNKELHPDCGVCQTSSETRGESITQAAINAGNIRFRPILMTAFSTIFGLMPLALSSGAGAVSRTSLGTVVLGGMIVSTALSLYAVPVFYTILTRAQRGIVGWFKSLGGSSRSSRQSS